MIKAFIETSLIRLMESEGVSTSVSRDIESLRNDNFPIYYRKSVNVGNALISAGHDYIEIKWTRQRWFGKVILIIVAFERTFYIVANLKDVYSHGKHPYFSAPYLTWQIDPRREIHPKSKVRHFYDISSEDELIGKVNIIESPFKKNYFVVNEPVLI